MDSVSCIALKFNLPKPKPHDAGPCQVVALAHGAAELVSSI